MRPPALEFAGKTTDFSSPIWFWRWDWLNSMLSSRAMTRFRRHFRFISTRPFLPGGGHPQFTATR